MRPCRTKFTVEPQFPTLQAPAGVATGNNSGYGEYVVGTSVEFASKDQQHHLGSLKPKTYGASNLVLFSVKDPIGSSKTKTRC